jgi:hypothetical protein
VKHSFLLDENILFHSIKGTDLHGNPDLTAMRLVILIATNCHSIRYNSVLLERYRHQLAKLKNERSKYLEPTFFYRFFFGNSLKAVMEDAEPPHLPQNAKIPDDDIPIVRAALISHPKLVTNDPTLMDAVNACEHLHLTALTPEQAMPFAAETCNQVSREQRQ